ncbi:MAG: hypothetical protein ABFD16_08565 [Thermoguttaceae bacterium]|jgi:hypothetical protein
METSLHRDLKARYAGKDAQFEVTLGDYRIDVIADGLLVEVQHGSLAAIRDKIKVLLRKHRVLVVKPIVVRKLLIKRAAQDGEIVGRRLSPKRGAVLDLFDDLVHFTQVFPHERLTLDVPLVDIEEWRYPGHGRRRRWRKNDHEVEDQKLVTVHEVHHLRTAADLRSLIACPLPEPFHTGHLAESLGVRRWIAQRITYCLRKMGVVREVGKQGNAYLYQFAVPPDEKKGKKGKGRKGKTIS